MVLTASDNYCFTQTILSKHLHGSVFDYVGLKDFKICPFLSLYHDKGA